MLQSQFCKIELGLNSLSKTTYLWHVPFSETLRRLYLLSNQQSPLIQFLSSETASVSRNFMFFRNLNNRKFSDWQALLTLLYSVHIYSNLNQRIRSLDTPDVFHINPTIHFLTSSSSVAPSLGNQSLPQRFKHLYMDWCSQTELPHCQGFTSNLKTSNCSLPLFLC